MQKEKKRKGLSDFTNVRKEGNIYKKKNVIRKIYIFTEGEEGKSKKVLPLK